MIVEWADADQLPHTSGTRALWLHPDLVAAYGPGASLVARRGQHAVGLWHVPLTTENGVCHARRRVRFLPYSAPWLEPAHPSKRRDVMVAFLDALQARVESIDLPLVPGFEDFTVCREYGILVEQRHTHVVDLTGSYRSNYSPALRNHIAAARRQTTLEVSDDPKCFDFQRAVVGQPPDAVTQREQFARRLAHVTAVRCFTARSHGSVVGQGLVVSSDLTAYYFHSWFDRQGPRGVPGRLIDDAMDLSRTELGAKVFDFEGSVVPSVDRFMSSFGARRSPYGHLLWHREPSEMATLIMRHLGYEEIVADQWAGQRADPVSRNGGQR